jgi:ribosomal protein S18 acetylase RimI-like enzyme
VEHAEIRRATAADAAEFTRVTQAAYEKYLARMPFRPPPMDADYRHLLATRHGWMAQDAGETVGVLLADLRSDHVLIENLAVLPSAQGSGLGVRLLATAEEFAVAVGMSEVRLYTNEVMTENLAFYARRGYRETGRSDEPAYRRVFFTKAVARSP